MHFRVLFLLGLLFSYRTYGVSEKECAPLGEAPETVPARVDVSEVIADVLSLKDVQGRTIVSIISPDFDAALRALFLKDQKSISKLEQFYGLLFYLAKYRSLSDRQIRFDVKSVWKLLVSSKVFSNPEFPKRISAVNLDFNPHKERASYQVQFDAKEIRLPLNAGKGFSSFREGMCQTAKELIFYGGFNFDVSLTVNHSHVVAQNFKNVDLFGTFGSRGIVNVDIQYVSLKSVEFLSGSPMGIVKAKVSKKEFEVNKHSMLLQLVSSLVTDKSTQAIDW